MMMLGVNKRSRNLGRKVSCGEKVLRAGGSMLKYLIFSAVFGLLPIMVNGAVAKNEQPSKEELEKEYYSNSFRAAPRDAFPVLFNPPMGNVKDGDGILQPNEWVIGIALKDEAKAYPVDVMGFHELINDVLGGTPITVCW